MDFSKRAQAGFEHLMVYGWAMVFFLTVASLLFFIFGILYSTVFFSSSDPQILFRAGSYHGKNIELELQNDTGGQISIIGISQEGYSDCNINSASPPVIVEKAALFQLTCSALLDKNGMISISYIDSSGFRKTAILSSDWKEKSSDFDVSKKFEFFDSGRNWQFEVYNGNWYSQTFIPLTDHQITKIKLLLFRAGYPGNVIASIHETDGVGKPFEKDLCIGTINGNELTTSDKGEWKQFNLEKNCSLSSGKKYAIILRTIEGNFLDRALWAYNSEGGYSRGESRASNDRGFSWITLPGDFLFEEYGQPK